MKHLNLLKSTLLLFALVVGSTSLWAKDAPYLALTFPDDNNANNHVSSYTSTWTAKTGTFEWSIAKFNNNNWNNGWTYIKCGNKTSASTCTITTSSTIDKAIRYVAVTVDATKNCTSNKLEVASNAGFTADLQTITGETLAAGVVRYYIPNPAENMYYRLTFEQKKGSNGDTQISQVAYCITSAPDDAEPEAVNTTPKVWDFSSSAAQSAAGTITANATTTLTATNGTSKVTYVAGGDDTFEASSKGYYLKPGGKSTMTGSAVRYFILNITESGILKVTSNSAKAGEYLIYQGSENDITKATKQASIITNSGKLTAYGEVDIANGEYVFIGFNAQIYTEKLTWMIPDGISFTTTDNMDGWRSFYESTKQNYEVDANTTIYTVASKTGESNKVELTAAAGNIIPGQTPVILKTTAGDHKIVLAKTETDANLGYNLLKAADGSAAIDGYRLGYGNIGGENAVGFFKYDGTPAAGTVYIASGDVTTSARELGIGFGDDVTAINKVEAKKAENGVFYNLTGQQVAQPTKGLYIVNGKKVAIK